MFSEGNMVSLQELWCKKMPPTAKLLKVYTPQQPPEPDKGPASQGPDQDALRRIIRTADEIGRLLQYRQQGFLPNARQQRMAGLAVIELAQAVRHLVSLPAHLPHPLIAITLMHT